MSEWNGTTRFQSIVEKGVGQLGRGKGWRDEEGREGWRGEVRR